MSHISLILAVFRDLGRVVAVKLGAGKKQRRAALHRAVFPRAHIVINSNGAAPVEAGGSRTIGAVWQDHDRLQAGGCWTPRDKDGKPLDLAQVKAQIAGA